MKDIIKKKIEKAIVDMGHVFTIAEKDVDMEIRVGDVIEIPRILKRIEVKEEVEEIERMVIEFSSDKAFPDSYYIFKGKTLSAMGKEENIKRIIKIVSALCEEKLSIANFKIYLWKEDYPIIMVYKKYVVLLAPYVWSDA